MLDDLNAERSVHNHHRNLLVAATGTGKTVIAALDYRRLAAGGKRPSLLFIAHRREILEHARQTFRDVVKDGSFGEFFAAGVRPTQWHHVFASIQSVSTETFLQQLDPQRFDVVVIDEFHHGEARTYQRLLGHVQPRELLGLTATPERADGKSIVQSYFGGRIASELRLWDALQADLLVPFHYYGIADGVDLSSLSFAHGDYRPHELSRAYTGNDARVRTIVTAVQERIVDPARMRALGFCVSVEHAHFMAERFNAVGIPSIALDGSSPAAARADGLARLRNGDLACIFAVDLFNEGLDIPMIDTILMLRPTQSATIFLQQLGRGLRRSEGKAVLTVLDFVGHQHRKFRFDLKFRALTGRGRARLGSDVQTGFPFLPPGSQIVLDRVVQEEVLKNISTQMQLSTAALVADVRETFGPMDAERAAHGLSEYLREADRGLADIYGTSGRTRRFEGTTRATSWLGLVDFAYPAQRVYAITDADDHLLRRVSALAHVDDPVRLAGYRELLTAPSLPGDIEQDMLAAMLVFTFWPHGGIGIREGLVTLRSSPVLVAEVTTLLAACADMMRTVARPLGGRLESSPLRSHARYSREELLAGLGMGTMDPGAPGSVREGVKWLPGMGVDALMVTLQKSAADYSPTTLYRDYALNSELFHWESQSTTRTGSATGSRYTHHERNNTSVVLFVRRTKSGDVGTEPYTCLGTATFVRSEGDRPMQIVWKLDRPMPPALLLDARAAA